MKLKIKLFAFSYLVLLVVMFVLPFFSVETYSIIKNTTSHLGAQNTPNSWVMNASFVLMGFTSMYGGWSHYKGFWFQRIILFTFCLSLILVAVYNHAPITQGMIFNVKEDKLHSLFASITGFSFTLLVIATGFIKKTRIEMILPISVGLIATLLSLMMFNINAYMGIWQRLIFIISFGWMLYEYKK